MSERHPQDLAESARALVASHSQGVLSTLAEDGTPYGSVVDLLPLENGDVALFLSQLAEHRRYLEADPRASVLIAPDRELSKPRVTLLGKVAPVVDRTALSDAYLTYHPEAKLYIHFADFQFFRLCVERVRFIAGFGNMGWIDGETYRNAFSSGDSL